MSGKKALHYYLVLGKGEQFFPWFVSGEIHAKVYLNKLYLKAYKASLSSAEYLSENVILFYNKLLSYIGE